MRTAVIEIDGISYPLCFSTRVIRACAERYGDLNEIFAALKNENQLKALDESLWLLAQMLDAGARYARLQGNDSPPPPDCDALYDLFDLADFATLKDKIAETVVKGREAQIETADEKKRVAQ